MSEHYSPRFHIDGPPKMTRREQRRIAGVKAAIVGMQDIVLPEIDPAQLDLTDRFSDHPRLFDPYPEPQLPPEAI